MANKCTDKEYCVFLTERMGDTYHQKGIVPLNLMNIETGNERHAGLVYKRTSNDRGLMLNYCPFCGVSIRKN